MPKRGDLICIKWVDAEESAGWGKHRRVKPKILKTYGLFVDQDSHFLYHASTRMGKHWSGKGMIPLGMVKEVIKIKTPQ